MITFKILRIENFIKRNRLLIYGCEGQISIDDHFIMSNVGIKNSVDSPLTFEKSKSFRSIEGEGRIFSGPFIEWLENGWLWLLPLTPLLVLILSLWWFDFSLDDSGDGETFEFEFAFELDEFSSSALLCCSLLELQWTGVFEFGRECGASAMGLRRLSLGRMELGGDPDSSFFGDFGRVNASACVWKRVKRRISLSEKLLTSLNAHQINWTCCTRDWFVASVAVVGD